MPFWGWLVLLGILVAMLVYFIVDPDHAADRVGGAARELWAHDNPDSGVCGEGLPQL
jgi:hypothetical protein